MAPDSIYGSLNILVLRVLTKGPPHGLAGKHALEAATGGELQVEPGSLYPALHRDGLVAGDWGLSPKGHRAKVYHLTLPAKSTTTPISGLRGPIVKS